MAPGLQSTRKRTRRAKSATRRSVKQVSAGVVVVRPTGNEWQYLLLRAYDYWDFPKGLLEPGEDSLTAARREVEEETTLANLEFRWGYDYLDTGPYGQGKLARYFVGLSSSGDVDLPIQETLGRPEHEEYRWVGYQEALALLRPRVARVLRWAKRTIGDPAP